MKTILYAVFISTLFITLSFADIINVPTDIDSIQGGIDLANNGDTVLVQPGTYVEHINFNGKNIVVGSLMLTTGDTSYISQTVIDADSSGRVVTIANGEDSTAVLCGFTITNGYAEEEDGGGIYVGGSSPRLSYLVVKDNIASGYFEEFGGWDGGNGGGITVDWSNAILENVSVKSNYAWRGQGSAGGGIYIHDSYPILINVEVIGNTHLMRGGGICCDESDPIFSNVTVTGNSAIYEGGGGIIFQGNCHPIFNPVNRCNIYFNEADVGPDLYMDESYTITIVVDTFTVMQPDDYFVYPENNFDFDILNAKVEQANSDLYVSPCGDDSNSGVSPMESLKTIDFALMRVMADSLEPHTIYLDDGEYSPSITGEKYPLKMRNYVSLQGESEEGVILSADTMVNEVMRFLLDREITIENLTIKGGVSCSNSNPILQNMTITQSEGTGFDCPYSNYNDNPSLLNVTITKNRGHGIDCWLSGTFLSLSNSTIVDNGRYGIATANYYPDSLCIGLCITNTIVWNNTSGNINPDQSNYIVYAFYSDIQGGWPGIGNINADPMFVDKANGDYRLQADSPCIDAGIQDTMIIYNGGKDTLIVPPKSFIDSAPDIGAFEFDPTIAIPTQTEEDIPRVFSLKQNYPNPFNPLTMINYQLPMTSDVELSIYNLLGQKVATLVNERKRAGYYQVEWDASGFSSGVYMYRLSAGTFIETKKLILLK